MMTFLEAIIKKLTLGTPSGSCCRVGDASFTVRYLLGYLGVGIPGRDLLGCAGSCQSHCEGKHGHPSNDFLLVQRDQGRREIPQDETSHAGPSEKFREDSR